MTYFSLAAARIGRTGHAVPFFVSHLQSETSPGPAETSETSKDRFSLIPDSMTNLFRRYGSGLYVSPFPARGGSVHQAGLHLTSHQPTAGKLTAACRSSSLSQCIGRITRQKRMPQSISVFFHIKSHTTVNLMRRSMRDRERYIDCAMRDAYHSQ